MHASRFVVLWAAVLALSGGALAQDFGKLLTRAEVEKVAGAKFGDPSQPMKSQLMFQQQGGDLQVSLDVEPRDATQTVRSWEATIRKMGPKTKVDTVPGIGKDAIYYATRDDLGALSADFDTPRVQMRVAVAGAKTPAQAKQIVVDLARIAAPRIGK
jgi:hypothetical protein